MVVQPYAEFFQAKTNEVNWVQLDELFIGLRQLRLIKSRIQMCTEWGAPEVFLLPKEMKTNEETESLEGALLRAVELRMW